MVCKTLLELRFARSDEKTLAIKNKSEKQERFQWMSVKRKINRSSAKNGNVRIVRD
jgi:hypothetical protein